jgi:H2-forming N5,N10-methylenetetrahydromethanopterin dehydrogenase-like enzyme
MLPNLNAGLQYLNSEIKMEKYSARLLSLSVVGDCSFVISSSVLSVVGDCSFVISSSVLSVVSDCSFVISSSILSNVYLPLSTIFLMNIGIVATVWYFCIFASRKKP